MHFVEGLPREAHEGELVGLDIEVYKMDWPRLHRPTGTFACLSIGFLGGDVYQVQGIPDLREALKRVKKGQWVIQNSLFDLRHLRRWATINERFVWDAMLVEQDLFGGWYDNFGLADLSRRWLNKELPKDVREKFSERDSMTQDMKRYAAMDASAVVEIGAKQMAYIQEKRETFRWYYEIDQPCIWAVLDMPPVKVDVDAWRTQAEFAAKEAARLEGKLGFNVKSIKQVPAAFKELGISLNSTGADVLLSLREKEGERSKAGKLVTAILQVRQYRDMSSKYGTQWLEENVERGGLVYADWKITGADKTGRMACADPNLQNIPIREFPIYRTFFIPSNGSMLISDVAQQEPTITAALSGDRALLAALATGDVYRPIGAALGVPRDGAKKVFLGSNYGLTEYGLAKQLNITLPQARAFMTSFFTEYKGVHKWMGQKKMEGREHEFVRTASGRRCWLNLHHYQWENNAINSPIQGTAADWTKLSLVNMHKLCKAEDLQFRTNMVIHDEKVSDVTTGLGAKYKRLDRTSWTEAGKKLLPGTPTHIEVYLGRSWAAKGE